MPSMASMSPGNFPVFIGGFFFLWCVTNVAILITEILM